MIKIFKANILMRSQQIWKISSILKRRELYEINPLYWHFFAFKFSIHTWGKFKPQKRKIIMKIVVIIPIDILHIVLCFLWAATARSLSLTLLLSLSLFCCLCLRYCCVCRSLENPCAMPVASQWFHTESYVGATRRMINEKSHIRTKEHGERVRRAQQADCEKTDKTGQRQQKEVGRMGVAAPLALCRID